MLRKSIPEDAVQENEKIFETLKYWVGFQLVSLTLWEEGASLALVGQPSSDGITRKIP